MDTSLAKQRQRVDPMLTYAMEIGIGGAGVPVMYSLQEGTFYCYKDGVWEGINDFELLYLASTTLSGINGHTIAAKKQILENLKMLKGVNLIDLNKKDLINLNNGMFDPVNRELLPHEEEYYSTIRIPYSYDPNAKCELWLKSLDEILEGDKDKLESLQEFCGYCLTRDTTQHKAMLLLGESRSGKSTILQTLRAVIGNKNCSSVPLKYISNPQYTPMLINKLVNIDTDVSSKAAEFEAEFKTITSGEPVSCNQKFVAAFNFEPHCKVVMAANVFPKITDHSSAFYKRLVLIPCDRVFKDAEQNKYLPEQLKAELPGILNWFVEGLKRLRERGRFEHKAFMVEAIQELEDENNPTNLFFAEHVEIVPNSYITKREMYDKYKNWCETTKNYSLSENRFSNSLYKSFAGKTAKNARLENGGKRIWRNLIYVENKFKPNSSAKEEIDWQN